MLFLLLLSVSACEPADGNNVTAVPTVEMPETPLPTAAAEETPGEATPVDTAQIYLVTLEDAGQSGTAVVYLSGEYALGGTCDTPRFEAQLQETARQFATNGEVAIFINDQPLAEILSANGAAEPTQPRFPGSVTS